MFSFDIFYNTTKHVEYFLFGLEQEKLRESSPLFAPGCDKAVMIFSNRIKQQRQVLFEARTN